MYRGGASNGGVYFSSGGYYKYGYGDPAPAPAPVAVQHRGGVYCFGGLKMYGTVLALLAAASLSLGIANVVLTREAYCNPWNEDDPQYCSATKEPYVWVWVAPGIWGSVPIFLAGLFAMCLSSHPAGWSRLFALFVFLSAIVFAPGMAVLSSIECWRGSASDETFYTMDSGVKEGSISPDDGEFNPYQAKFALPLVIAILACLEFIMTAIVTLQLCCCGHSLGIFLDTEVSVSAGARVITQPPVATQEVYYPSRPQVREVDVYRPTYQSAVRYNPGGGGISYGYSPSRAQFNLGAAVNAGLGVSSGPAYRSY